MKFLLIKEGIDIIYKILLIQILISELLSSSLKKKFYSNELIWFLLGFYLNSNLWSLIDLIYNGWVSASGY